MYNVKDYGALGDGKSLDSGAIQRAIDACAEAGGGTVYIPEGSYVCGTMHIKSNVCVHLDLGATIYGSTNPNDFDPYEVPTNNLYQDRSHSFFHHSLFHADGETHIALTGLGTIDMQSVWEVKSWFVPEIGREDEWCRACKIVALKNCKDVTIRDLTMKNATDLAVYFAGCEQVLVTGLKMRVHIDGISPDSCRDVVISDCIIEAGDDGIVMKSSYTLGKFRPMENLVISNCVVSSFCSGIKFGTESNTGFINITVTGCVIYNTRLSALALEAVDGAVIDGISISNISMRNVGNPLLITVQNRGRGPEGTPLGQIKNVSLSNITVVEPVEPFVVMAQNAAMYAKGETTVTPHYYPFLVMGDPKSPIRNVSLSNIQVMSPGGGTEEMRNIEVPEVHYGYPECNRFGNEHPAHGMIARDVDNLKLYNVDFYTEAPDARDPIALIRVTRFKEV